MEYRVLGRSGLRVSAIGVGTWQLSGPLDIDGKANGYPDVGHDAAVHLIHGCEDLGINLIDSAEIYGAGEGERRVGAALKGRRDRWIVSTKFGVRRGAHGERIQDPSPSAIATSLENSLQRLQTDYVDIYLYHTEPDPTQIAAGRAALESLKQQGKLRYYGISTDDPQIVAQLIEHSAVDIVMYMQSLLTHPDELLGLLKAHNLGGMVRGALEAGRLSGAYFRRRPRLSKQDFRESFLKFDNTLKYAAYKRFLPPNTSMAAFAIRYLLDFDTTHTIALGGKSIAHYQAAVQAFDLPPLSPATHQALPQIRQALQERSFKRKVMDKLQRFMS